MENEQKLHKEIDLVQDVLKRMAANSFRVKAWTMAILGGVLALSKEIIFQTPSTPVNEVASISLSIFLVLEVIVFWYLDGFFLRAKRRYKNLYQWLLEYRHQTDEYLYDLNTFTRAVNGKSTEIKAPSVIKAMLSKTLLPFYVLPFLFVAVLLVYNLGLI